MAGKSRIRRVCAAALAVVVPVAAEAQSIRSAPAKHPFLSTPSTRTQAKAAGVTPAATESWIEVRTPHFVVASNAGEVAARSVAGDFEQIRALFHATFPELRIDPPQPIRILVAGDEATMRMISPDQWGGPEHVHPSGVFHSDGEKDYVVLRLDAE